MPYHEATQVFSELLIPPMPALLYPEQQIAVDNNLAEIATAAGVAEPQPEQTPPQRKHVVAKMAAGAALANVFAGTLLLGGAGRAEAASAATTTEAAPQGSDFNLGLAGFLTSIAATAIAVWSINRQAKDKKEDRFQAALQSLADAPAENGRVMRWHALTKHTKFPEYAPQIFETALAHFWERRGELEVLYHTISDPEQLEHAIMKRRNGDRSALKALLATLPAAQRQLQRRTGTESAFQDLDKLTGIQMEEKTLVEAAGICLDNMRSIKRCDFANVNLTGAGLQKNQITSVIFTNARLCEAQFAETTVLRCDLRQADLRAAHFHGATFDNCVVNGQTKFGNLPDDHPDAKYGSLRPNEPDKYRGHPEVILKNLISDTLSKQQIKDLVWSWQENGLVLQPGSTPEYFLDTKDSLNDTSN